MSRITIVEIPVEAETAEALTDAHRREAVGRLVDIIVRPGGANDPLATVLEETRRRAQDEGPTDAAIDEELAAYNAERRDG